MSYEILKGLEPAEFYHWLGAISEIPRGSWKEAQIIAFLENFAAERGLYRETDEAGNVYMRVPATPGYEEEPLILFQAHMDMVWVKTPESDFDFETQPIDLTIRDGCLMAKETTLGTDNGVGLATMLALADGSGIPHPELELLFTVEEEIGLKGIRKFDMDRIRARRMINMDCGDSHVVAVSSAGSAKMEITREFPLEPCSSGSAAFLLRLEGLTGGHSGLTINEGKACAANVAGSLLAALPPGSFRLFRAESAKSPILKRIEIGFCIEASEAETAVAALQTRFETARRAYAETDPGMRLAIDETAVPERALTAADSLAFTALLQLLVTGPYKTDPEDHSILITSGNIGTVLLEDGALRLIYNIRSSEDNDKLLRVEHARFLTEYLGYTFNLLDSYSGWPEKKDSPFRKKFIRIHEQLFGKEPELERVHGGIEVGMITGAIPEMDAVGIAPTARGAHTTEERLYLDEVPPYWQLMKAILAERDT